MTNCIECSLTWVQTGLAFLTFYWSILWVMADVWPTTSFSPTLDYHLVLHHSVVSWPVLRLSVSSRLGALFWIINNVSLAYLGRLKFMIELNRLFWLLILLFCFWFAQSFGCQTRLINWRSGITVYPAFVIVLHPPSFLFLFVFFLFSGFLDLHHWYQWLV